MFIWQRGNNHLVDLGKFEGPRVLALAASNGATQTIQIAVQLGLTSYVYVCTYVL